MFDSVARVIEQLVAPILDDLAVHLIELNVKRKGQVLAVEVLADKADGGITLDDCTLINRSLVNKIEEEGLIEDEYVVEVSSPGADRPLKTEQDFQRVVGKNVHFYLKEPVEGKSEVTGTIKGVERDKVFITAQIQLAVINIDNIKKAIQVI